MLEKGDAILECGNSLYTDTQPALRLPRSPRASAISASACRAARRARGTAPRSWSAAPRRSGRTPSRSSRRSRPSSTASRAAPISGEGGAGHFVKTIHNGIEYGDMQMIAEVYGVMRDGLGMNPKACVGRVQGVEQGTAQLLPHRNHRLRARGDRAEDRQAAGRADPRQGRPEGHRRAGRRSPRQQLGVPATAIEGAVAARSISSRKDERVAAEKALRQARGRQEPSCRSPISRRRCSRARSSPTRRALRCWPRPARRTAGTCRSPTIAKIWRNGCIIRSRFLDQMTAAYAKGGAQQPADGARLRRPS